MEPEDEEEGRFLGSLSRSRASLSMGSPAFDVRVEERGLLFGVYERTVFRWLLERLPAGLRPNSITIAGQVCAACAGVAAALAAHGARLLYPASAALFGAFLLADNLDGMHARRTGQVSRSGEILDHGMDGLAGISALLSFGFLLHVQGATLLALAYLGTVGFVAAYWEQYRTGLLVCPAVGQSEGLTGLMLIAVALFVFGDGAWSHFSPYQWRLSTVFVYVMCIGYAFTTGEILLRASPKGAPLGELLAIVASASLSFGFVALGAAAWIVALVVGIFGAELVARTLLLRNDRRRRSLIGWQHLAIITPLPVAAYAFFHGLGGLQDTCAAVSLTIALGMYARTLTLALRHAKQLAEETC